MTDISTNHWRMAAFTEVVTAKQLTQIALEHDTIIRMGVLCDLKNKRIAPSVYRIWYEQRKY